MLLLNSFPFPTLAPLQRRVAVHRQLRWDSLSAWRRFTSFHISCAAQTLCFVLDRLSLQPFKWQKVGNSTFELLIIGFPIGFPPRLGYNHGVLYYRPLHRDNWGLILVLIEINRGIYHIIFHKLPSIYSKMA